MAYRVRAMGMDRELEQKTEQKYSQEDETELVEWVVSVIMFGKQIQNFEDSDIKVPECEGKLEFMNWLMDGHILCDLMNVLQPNSCKPQPTGKCSLPAMRKSKEMNNICLFLEAAESYGVKKVDLFQTIDLYEARDLAQVQVTLYKLGSVAQSKKFRGPVIGVKVAEKNIRNFAEIKKTGSGVIGLQMGTNAAASQKGMTPYGLGRQMVTKVNGKHGAVSNHS